MSDKVDPRVRSGDENSDSEYHVNHKSDIEYHSFDGYIEPPSSDERVLWEAKECGADLTRLVAELFLARASSRVARREVQRFYRPAQTQDRPHTDDREYKADRR